MRPELARALNGTRFLGSNRDRQARLDDYVHIRDKRIDRFLAAA